MTEQQRKELIKKFATDLGIALGASKDIALLKGMLLLLKMDLKVALNLMTVWQNAENAEQGSGPKAIQQTILKMQKDSLSYESLSLEEDVPDESESLVDMAKLGTKMDYIRTLNGRCPEGYEVEKYLAGGCVKCKKGRKMHMLNLVKSQPIEDRISLFKDGGTSKVERFHIKETDKLNGHELYSLNGVSSAWATINPKGDSTFYHTPLNENYASLHGDNLARLRFYELQKKFMLQEYLKRLNLQETPSLLQVPASSGASQNLVLNIEQRN